MGRRCTAGGFAVIPEQARQYGPFKGFLLFVVWLVWALDGTVSHDSIPASATHMSSHAAVDRGQVY